MKTKFQIMFFMAAVIAIAVTSCSKNENDPTDSEGVASCAGCHTNYAHLQAVHSPDTSAPAGGCGGEAPHYEPYDRVFMGGQGYEDYKSSSHGKQTCTSCHGGVDNTDDKAVAHSGDFVAHPSTKYKETCGSCHSDETTRFENSIHNGYGQMRAVALRSGYEGSGDFDKLPQHQIEGYNKNCATCHGTCGNCHVVRPPIAGGGLSAGHNFNKTPDMIKVCISCHTSRGGHAYLGVASGTQPDVHLTNAQFTCIDCHSGHEMHGGAQKVEQRYAVQELPKCADCHQAVNTSNVYHSVHIADFSCQVCHSQDYNNCGSCHIGGVGARFPAYMDYKIAGNTIPDIKPDHELTLVRRTLAAIDNWEKYGVSQYSNFNAKPTYNYTTPHNILRWTSRTTHDAGESCSSNCHIRNENGFLVNKNLYLFEEDLLEWEIGATKPYTVDNKLPASWFVQN
jgi:hypothetical protein